MLFRSIHAQPASLYLDTYMDSLVLLNVEDGALGRQEDSSSASKDKD